MIFFMVVVPVVVTPQIPIALVWICPHRQGPFKIGVVPDEGEQPIIGDVKGGELGRFCKTREISNFEIRAKIVISITTL